MCGWISSIRTCPEVGSRTPRIMLMVVVLPAPFGPSSPTISCRRTSNEISSTARTSPYRLQRRSTDSTVIAVDPAGGGVSTEFLILSYDAARRGKGWQRKSDRIAADVEIYQAPQLNVSLATSWCCAVAAVL